MPYRRGMIAMWPFLFVIAGIGATEKRFPLPVIPHVLTVGTKHLERHQSHPGNVHAPMWKSEAYARRPLRCPQAFAPMPTPYIGLSRAYPSSLERIRNVQLITEADKQWRKGYLAGQAVEMRWHRLAK